MAQVSIIIPVYNVEDYLVSAIESVLAQTYNDWELLLLNDGSLDASLSICKEFARRDQRIKVIDKLNSGVSDTRNIGLDLAVGKYVTFLDSDDFWIDRTFLGKFVKLAEDNNLDIVRGEYKAVDVNGSELFIKEIDKKKKKSTNTLLNSSSFLDNVIQREFFLPLCLIKYDIIKDIRFNTERVFLEDVEFFLQTLLKPLRGYYNPICFYAYRKHNSSVSHNYNEKRLSDAFDISRLYLNLSLRSIDVNLVQSFKIRSWDYYWLTLRTIAVENSLFDKGKLLCKQFNLDRLKKDLSKIITDIDTNFKWLHWLSPYGVVCYFRIRYMVGKLYRNIKSYIK